jgi:hypothetical protein
LFFPSAVVTQFSSGFVRQMPYFHATSFFVQIGIPVRGGTGAVVEFCLAKWWANLGLVDAQYTITFQGLLPNPSRTSKHTIMPVGQSESIKCFIISPASFPTKVGPANILSCLLVNQRVLNDFSLSYGLTITPLPPPSPVGKLSLFLSLPVCRWPSMLTGGGLGRAKSYDSEKAWSSNHSMFSAVSVQLYCIVLYCIFFLLALMTF